MAATARPVDGAVDPPIYASSTFAQCSPGVHKGWEYSRSGNPTRAAFEAALADLEGGARGFAFASGLAAEACRARTARSRQPRDRVRRSLWRHLAPVPSRARTLGQSRGHPCRRSDPAALEAAITPATRMIWVETPGNPLLKLADLGAIAAIAKRRGGILTVADNTFASPAVQRPLEIGIDIVVHSVTKYIGGHSDIDRRRGDRAATMPSWPRSSAFLQNATGGILDPFYSFLGHARPEDPALARRTPRRQRARRRPISGGSPQVARVFYPGLPSHPQHEHRARSR